MKLSIVKLQIAMANACMNKRELAQAAGISIVSVSKYFSCKRFPTPKTLGKLAKVLNVPVENLIDMEG